MPITRFSWPALKEHIRKYGWLYIVLIILSLFLSNLIWTITRPQTPSDQKVLIYLADAAAYPEALQDVADEMLIQGQKFDEQLQEVEFQHLQFTDPEKDYTSGMVLMARLSTGDADAFIANEDAMVSLANLAALDLKDYVADGWLAQCGLEGQYITLVDDETGEERTIMAAIPLDSVNALKNRGAFENENAYLVIAANGTNIETTMKTIEVMMEILTEESNHVSAENTAPVA